jgi:hypothetical protein
MNVSLNCLKYCMLKTGFFVHGIRLHKVHFPSTFLSDFLGNNSSNCHANGNSRVCLSDFLPTYFPSRMNSRVYFSDFVTGTTHQDINHSHGNSSVCLSGFLIGTTYSLATCLSHGNAAVFLSLVNLTINLFPWNSPLYCMYNKR